MKRLQTSLLVLLCAAVFACQDSGDLPIVIVPQSDTDKLVVETDAKGRATLHIRSPNGIGSAQVALVRDAATTGFKVVLHLAALEGFVVRSAHELHRLSVSSEGRVLLEPPDSRVLHMNELEAMKTAGEFSIFVSVGNFAEPVSEFRLEWVDYYR